MRFQTESHKILIPPQMQTYSKVSAPTQDPRFVKNDFFYCLATLVLSPVINYTTSIFKKEFKIRIEIAQNSKSNYENNSRRIILVVVKSPWGQNPRSRRTTAIAIIIESRNVGW